MSAMAAQASTSGGNVVTDVPILDPNIWSNLQDQDPDTYHGLLNTIFGKLPFREFFQFRVVCREWHQLASDQTFLEKSFTEFTPKPYFVLTFHPFWDSDGKILPADELLQRHGLLSYDASCKRWSWTWLPLLPTGSRGSQLTMEGLIFRADQVMNLHTRVFRTLPQPPDDPSTLSRRWPYIGMTLDRSESPYTFQIVLGSENHTMIYNSRTNSWTQKGTQQPPDPRSGRTQIVTSCAHRNGFLYITGPSWYSHRHDQQDWAMRYNLERDLWEKIKLPQPDTVHFPYGYRDFYVGAWQDRLFCVSDPTLDGPKAVSVKVWELINNTDRSEQHWTEVASMPEHLHRWLKLHDFHRGRKNSIEIRLELCLVTTSGCSFCGEYVLVYTWMKADSLTEIRFVMCNLDTKDDDRSKLVWTGGRVPLEDFSISKERDWPESQPADLL